MNDRKRFLRGYGLVLIIALLAALAIGLYVNIGCDSCADEGEYCVDLDCCGDLVCRFDQTAGYRCRP